MFGSLSGPLDRGWGPCAHFVGVSEPPGTSGLPVETSLDIAALGSSVADCDHQKRSRVLADPNRS
jgi:hypothetical protein